MKTLALMLLIAALAGCASDQAWNWPGALQGFNEGMQAVQQRQQQESERLERQNHQRREEDFQEGADPP
jgi:hypothetical protein